MYEQPEPARRIGPLLIVVLLVLAGVGGTMGYLVAHQVLLNRAEGAGNGSGGRGAGTTTPGTTTPGATTPAGQTPTATVKPDPADDGTFCPPQTTKALLDAGLNGDLTLLLYVETKLNRGPARGWICRNADGVLFYQGHERFAPLDRASNAVNTILLGKGIKGEVVADGDGFKATNPKPDGSSVTTYRVDRQTFSIEPGGTSAAVTRSIAP